MHENEAIKEDELKPLNEKDKLFIETFVRTLSKTKAGKAVKLSAPGINAQEYYKRPHIKAEIIRRIKENTTAPEVNIKAIDEIANTNINDYMRTRKVTKMGFGKVPLAEFIERKKRKLQIAEMVHDRKVKEGAFLNPKAVTWAIKALKEKQTEVFELEAELAIDPLAYRMDDVEQTYEETYLDLAALRRSGVMIKSYKMTKEGVQVELYSALDAKKEIAKISGSYELDNQQKAPNVKLLSFDPLSEVEPSEETPDDED